MHAINSRKMKYYPYWDKKSTSYDPLRILALIEKTVLDQTEDQYPFATVYKQECSNYSFSHNTLSNEQWYERFNTKIDVVSAINLTRKHQVILSHVAEEYNKEFEDMTPEEKKETREDAGERIPGPARPPYTS